MLLRPTAAEQTINYVEVGTPAYLKHKDNSIRECKVSKVFGINDQYGNFKINYIWRIAGIGEVNQKDISQYGSLKRTYEDAKHLSVSSVSQFPHTNASWSFACDLLEVGFVNGNSLYKMGHLNFYKAILYRLRNDGTIHIEDKFGFRVDFDENNNAHCSFDNETIEKLGKNLFFTEEEAKESFKPKFYSLDDEVEKKEVIEKIVKFEITTSVKVSVSDKYEDVIAKAVKNVRTCNDKALFDACTSCATHQ